MTEMSMRAPSRSVVSRKKLLDGADHPIDFVIRQFSEHWQGDILPGIAFRFGQGKLPKAATQPGLMAVQRYRIVNSGPNLSRSKKIFQLISMGSFNDVLMVDALPIFKFRWCFERQTGEFVAVCRRYLAPSPIVAVEGRQFHSQHSGLQFVQAAVPAVNGMIVFFRLAMHAQQSNRSRQFTVVGEYDPAIAIAGQIFNRPQTHGGDRSKTSRALATINGALCLRRIFDDRNSTVAGDLADSIHVAGKSKKMDGHDRFGIARYGAS